MIIGAISDSHRETKVAASAIEWLLARGADLLVHAEGIVESETLRLLRQSGKPYFAVLGNSDEALIEFKNDFNLHDEPFCTEFAGLGLKIMHHPFYLFDEEPAAQNEAGGLNLNAGAGADRVANSHVNFSAINLYRGVNHSVNFHKNFDASLIKNSSFSDEVSYGTNLGSNCGAGHREILVANSKAAAYSANLNSNASANLNANMDSDMKFKASSSADSAVNLTAPSLNANLSSLNSCVNLAVLSLGSNLTTSSDSNTSGESKNRGPCERDADKISTIKIYGHTHFFAAAIDKNGVLVLNPGEICGHKSDFPVCLRCGARAKIASI